MTCRAWRMINEFCWVCHKQKPIVAPINTRPIILKTHWPSIIPVMKGLLGGRNNGWLEISESFFSTRLNCALTTTPLKIIWRGNIFFKELWICLNQPGGKSIRNNNHPCMAEASMEPKSSVVIISIREREKRTFLTPAITFKADWRAQTISAFPSSFLRTHESLATCQEWKARSHQARASKHLSDASCLHWKLACFIILRIQSCEQHGTIFYPELQRNTIHDDAISVMAVFGLLGDNKLGMGYIS